MTFAIMGANGSVGLNLLAHAAAAGDVEVLAGVRSDRARASLPDLPRVTALALPYDDVKGWAAAFEGVSCVVHLAGILIEWPGTSYQSANVATTAAVVEAARKAEVPHIVLISVVGAGADSPNRYFRSKGEAERVVAESGMSATIIRTPILLGPGTAGAASLVRTVGQGRARLLGGGGYTMRPLDVDDLSRAVLGVCRARPDGVAVHELVGPQPITYRALVEKCADLMGKELKVGATPVWLAKFGAGVRSRVKGGGVSPTVIDVITADEVVENNADGALGITLTPLSDTLRKILPETERPI